MTPLNLLLWVAGPVGRWVVLAVVLTALYAAHSYQQRSIGEDRAKARIDHANDAAHAKADAGERDVLNCVPPREWVRGKGCDPGASR